MFVVITGIAGSGKTTFRKILEEFRMAGKSIFSSIDADEEAKNAYEKPEVKDELVRLYGDIILNYQNKIDLRKIEDILFASKVNYEKIISIVWPATIEIISKKIEQIKAKEKRWPFHIALEAALFLEAEKRGLTLNQKPDYVFYICPITKAKALEKSNKDLTKYWKYQLDPSEAIEYLIKKRKESKENKFRIIFNNFKGDYFLRKQISYDDFF